MEISEGDAAKFREDNVYTRAKLNDLGFKSVADKATDVNILIDNDRICNLETMVSSAMLDEAEAEYDLPTRILNYEDPAANGRR